MIALDLTTRKLQAFLAGAPSATNPTATVVFYDVPEAEKNDQSAYRHAPQFTVLAGATETDICAAPAQGVVRHVVYINIYNADSATVIVTVCVDDGGTNRIQVVMSLLTTESAVWTPESSWNVVT